MSLIYNGVEVTDIIYNGTALTDVFYNGVQVYKAQRDIVVTGFTTNTPYIWAFDEDSLLQVVANVNLTDWYDISFKYIDQNGVAHTEIGKIRNASTAFSDSYFVCNTSSSSYNTLGHLFYNFYVHIPNTDHKIGFSIQNSAWKVTEFRFLDVL